MCKEFASTCVCLWQRKKRVLICEKKKLGRNQTSLIELLMECADIMFFQGISTLAAGPRHSNSATPSLPDLRLHARLGIPVYSRVRISRSPDSGDGQLHVCVHNSNYGHLPNINKRVVQMERCSGEFHALDKTDHSLYNGSYFQLSGITNSIPVLFRYVNKNTM